MTYSDMPMPVQQPSRKQYDSMQHVYSAASATCNVRSLFVAHQLRRHAYILRISIS